MPKQITKQPKELHDDQEYSFVVSPDEKKRVLNQRATLLMTEVGKEDLSGEQLTGIEFLLGEEHYFVESKFVTEVIYLKELTTLPSAPSFLSGIINVRGKILAVISLKDILKLPDSGITNANRVILVNHLGIELGILADEIIGIQFVFLDKLQAVIPGITGTQIDYLLGVTSNGLMVLDFEKLLSNDKININETVNKIGGKNHE